MAQRPTRAEFMIETTMISRMIVNYAFADRTEYSVRTGHRFAPGHVHQTTEAAGEALLVPRLQSTLYLDNI